jgi:hypothetical protein
MTPSITLLGMMVKELSSPASSSFVTQMVCFKLIVTTRNRVPGLGVPAQLDGNTITSPARTVS